MSKRVWKTIGIISAVAGVAAGATAIAKHKLNQQSEEQDADDFVEVSDGIDGENPEDQVDDSNSDSTTENN